MDKIEVGVDDRLLQTLEEMNNHLKKVQELLELNLKALVEVFNGSLKTI